MTWNYRIAKRIVDNPLAGGKDTIYNIVEAYYDGNGKIWGITDACYPQGNTLEEFKQDLVLYCKSVLYPVIEAATIPEQGAINPLDEMVKEDIAIRNLEEIAKELRNNP